MSGDDGVKVEIRKLSEFRPLQHNPNRHTPRGLKALEDAMQEVGYVAPLTVAADGESLDGAARLEVSYEHLGDEAIVVEHDGTRPVVMVRTDVPNASTPIAKRIIYGANRVAELDLDWDFEQIEGDLAAGLDLSGLWDSEEWAAVTRAEFSFLEGMAGEGDEKDGDGPKGGPAGYPLAIVLQRDELARWQAWKEGQGVRDDRTAFLVMLTEAGG